MPWKEFRNLITEALISLVGGGTLSLNNSIRTGDFSTELEEFKRQYPFLKKELIDRRDTYMSTNIVKLFRKNNSEKIVAIVGEGHLSGMVEKLVKLNPKVVKLSDLLQNSENSVSFSIEI
jgi:pheromone shutdown protein TraB